jgi:hypothetical protein
VLPHSGQAVRPGWAPHRLVQHSRLLPATHAMRVHNMPICMQGCALVQQPSRSGPLSSTARGPAAWHASYRPSCGRWQPTPSTCMGPSAARRLCVGRWPGGGGDAAGFQQLMAPSASHLGLYGERQVAGLCAAHALSAMHGRALFAQPHDMVGFLQHPNIPPLLHNWRELGFGPEGWLSTTAINRYLAYAAGHGCTAGAPSA